MVFPDVSVSRGYVLRQFDSEAAVESFATSLGWEKVTDLPSTPQQGAPRRVGWLVAPGLVFTFMQNEELRLAYVSFVSRLGQEIADRLTALVEKGLDVCSDADLLRAVAEADAKGERVAAVTAVGIGAPQEFEESFFQVIRAAGEDADPAIRIAAIDATYYTEWSVLADLVRSMTTSDRKKPVRKHANRVLKALQAEGKWPK